MHVHGSVQTFVNLLPGKVCCIFISVYQVDEVLK